MLIAKIILLPSNQIIKNHLFLNKYLIFPFKIKVLILLLIFFEQRLKNNLFFDNLCSGNVSLNHCHTLRSQDSQFLSKSYISSPDIQLSNPTPITDASLTQSELSSADAIQLSINHIGLLYNSQCCLNITATKKILLSLINKLCTTPFARAHDGYINLTDAQIASKAPDLFNARPLRSQGKNT